MERNRSVTLNSRGSFLNNSHNNRFKKSSSSPRSSNTTTHRYRTNSLSSSYRDIHDNNNSNINNSNNGFRTTANPSPMSSPAMKQNALKINNIVGGNKMRLKKIDNKIMYGILATTVIVLWLGGDGGRDNSMDNSNFADLLSGNDISKDNAMSNFVSNNSLEFPIEDGNEQGEITKLPKRKRFNPFKRNKNRRNKKKDESQHIVKQDDSARLNGAASQLIDALHLEEEQGHNHVQLTITLNNGEEEKLLQRSSGLQVSPGIPLPDQKLERSRFRKKLYKPTQKLLSKIKTYPHQISDLNCVLYNGPGEFRE